MAEITRHRDFPASTNLKGISLNQRESAGVLHMLWKHI